MLDSQVLLRRLRRVSGKGDDPMQKILEDLVMRQLLSISEPIEGLRGYRLAGILYDVFNLIDNMLIDTLAGHACEEHSCPPLMGIKELREIGYFNSLPSIPFYALPHRTDSQRVDSACILAPSACYSTFQHISRDLTADSLRVMTVRGTCHRAESSMSDPTRLAFFTMREIVVIGDTELVASAAKSMFQAAAKFLTFLVGDCRMDPATDVFYGETASAARSMQEALGSKEELSVISPSGQVVTVGSVNYHRNVLARAFGLKTASGDTPSSACVAFGLERLLLSLLSCVPNHEPEELTKRLVAAGDRFRRDQSDLHERSC